MKTSLRTRFAIVVAALVLPLVTACEDPSNVGIGLVGGQTGSPTDTSAAVVDMENMPIERQAGVPSRVLVGDVDDPLLGRIGAEGYMDFGPGGNSDFRGGTVERAELRLRPSYVYGDTTGDVTVAIRTVLDPWELTGLPVDTSFDAGDIVSDFTFSPTDTLVVVSLPQTWVESYDDTLRSQTFAEGFYGFRLEHVSGGAVVGFGPEATILAAFTEDDSAAFAVSRGYSGLERSTPANLPAQRALVQAGVGPGVSFQVDINEAHLMEKAINRAALTFWSDTLTTEQNLPAGFVRPQLTRLDLFGITTDGSIIYLDGASLDERGRFVFRSRNVAVELQDMALGKRSFERFELRIPGSLVSDPSEIRLLAASINAVLLLDTGADENAPVTYLTLTPIDG